MKLLVSDYDGTINFRGSIKDEDLESLKRFYNQGNILSIASSRPYESLHNEMMIFKVPFNLLICNNGNAIFDNNGLVDFNSLNIEELIAFRKLLKDLPKNSKITAYDAYGRNAPNNPLYYRIILDNNYDFESFYQMFYECGFDADYYLNNGIVFSGKREKAYATKYAIEKYGIKSDEVYTIGDGDNDYEMLKDYNGYTFSWSSPKVKELKLPVVNSISEVINGMRN